MNEQHSARPTDSLSECSHTPGPWHIEKRRDCLWIAVPGDAIGYKVLAEVNIGFIDSFEAQQQANAKLIAAAPDLIAALKEARQYVMLASPSGKPFDFPRETIDSIDAAIAKAEGRS